MAVFNDLVNKLFPTLEKFVPVVDRVHGNHHPEFHDVRKLFDTIKGKLKEEGTVKADLGEDYT